MFPDEGTTEITALRRRRGVGALAGGRLAML